MGKTSSIFGEGRERKGMEMKRKKVERKLSRTNFCIDFFIWDRYKDHLLYLIVLIKWCKKPNSVDWNNSCSFRGKNKNKTLFFFFFCKTIISSSEEWLQNFEILPWRLLILEQIFCSNGNNDFFSEPLCVPVLPFLSESWQKERRHIVDMSE